MTGQHAASTSMPHRDAHAASEGQDLAPQVWETELFVVRGDDREHLLQQAKTLLAFCRRQRHVEPKDLAFSLNARLAQGGSRLAIVASSCEELCSRLERALQRLADPACDHVNDSLGIYFVARPLYPQGGVALLFPGEGAQYLGMVGDLGPHFPEVQACLDFCDSIGDETGDHDLGSRFLRVPDDLAEERRAVLDAELRQLDHAMGAVLSADLALQQLIEQLAIPVTAMAGHSAGELAALWSAGCLDIETELARVSLAMQQLTQDAHERNDAESLLLAVGASRDVVQQAIQQAIEKQSSRLDQPPVYLAMHNCPHQSVVVGLAEAMVDVEAEIKSRRLIYERLTIERPYHTRLFEPYMAPLRQMFEGVGFRSPHTTVYSSTTGWPFPADPEEIRSLALAHWISPVEFTQTIENMYDDGVRLFVEAGPRGNLCSFVSDILRGRRFLAVPANVSRRSSITQLNHMAAQLAAHHVPMRLEHFYARRNPRPIDWEAGAAGRPLDPVRAPAIRQAHNGESTSAATAPATSQRANVMNEYFAVMQQFLDTQTEITEQYFRRRRRGDATPDQARTKPTLPATDAPPRAAPQAPPAAWALQGEIIKHEPGQELVMRRQLDLAEDLYAQHHTVGGRSVSKVDPNQHGLPIVPMTFTLEWMAEAASQLLPGKVVVGLQDVSLFRWLGYTVDVPTVQVTAKLRTARTSAGQTEVAVKVDDLGSLSSPQGGTAAVATVLLADQYAKPPPPRELDRQDARRCTFPLDVLYKNLFHGELFQGVESLEETSAHGIDARVCVLPRDTLFASTPDPRFVMDPVLLDVAMHPMAGWHLDQPDQAGRTLLPFALERIDVYGPPPPPDTRLVARGFLDHGTSRQFVHGIDVIAAGGKLVYRMQGLKYYRFYLPVGEFHFHGPKDAYFLSENWPDALPRRTDDDAKPRAWCVRLKPLEDLQKSAILLASTYVMLSPRERAQYDKLQTTDAERSLWLYGRVAVKDAVRMLWRKTTGERPFMADVEIDIDEHGNYVVSPRGANRPVNYPQVAIAHSDGLLVGLAALEPYVGIDIQRVPLREADDDVVLDADERKLLAAFGADRDDGVARFRSAKNAVAQALGGSGSKDAGAVAVRRCDATSGEIHVHVGGPLAAALSEAHGDLLRVHTHRDETLIVATTLCERVSP